MPIILSIFSGDEHMKGQEHILHMLMKQVQVQYSVWHK